MQNSTVLYGGLEVGCMKGSTVKTLVVRYLRIYSQEVLKRVSAFLYGIRSAIRTLLDLINRHTQFY